MISVSTFDGYLEQVNLVPVNYVLCFTGAMLSVAVMQLSTQHGDLMQESKVGIALRRFSLCLLALALMWGCTYSATKGWQPWPPHVFLVLVLDFVLALRAAQIVVRCRQFKYLFDDQRRRARALATGKPIVRS